MHALLQRLRRASLPREDAEISNGHLETFVKRRDEAAFAALMNLHGPMVFGVCKRVLGDHHDTEEAFQATFLILSHKAASIMPRNRVGDWLYGVAYRTAMNAKRMRNRRRKQEVQVTTPLEPATAPRIDWIDVAPLLDFELNALPEKYRTPVVLVDLEGRSHKEVAQELGWPEGTLASRLMRARNLLKKRLGMRGISLPVGAMTILITENSASAAVPASIMLPVIQATQLAAFQQSVASGVISPSVAAITEGTLKSMFMTTIKQAIVGLILLAGFGLGGAALLQQSLAQQLNAQANVAKPEDEVTYHFAGTVVDEHGNPAVGAKIWMEYWRKDMAINDPLPLALTDEQGKFEIHCKNTDFSDEAEPNGWLDYGFLVASKDRHGVNSGNKLYFETTGQMESYIDSQSPKGWKANVEKYWGAKSDILKLVADDAPVRGRILNRNDQPVAGAKVEAIAVEGTADGTLANWEIEAKKPDAYWWSDALRIPLLRPISGHHVNANDAPTIPSVFTDENGNFTLHGIGRERLAQVVVSGKGIETAVLRVRTRPGEIIEIPTVKPPATGPYVETIYPNQFTVKVGPSMPVEGFVTNQKTGQPLENVLVQADLISSYQVFNSTQAMVIRTVTDANGHYLLEGLPIGENGYQLIPPLGSQCQNGFVTVATTLNSKSPLKVVTQSLPAGIATGMAMKRNPPALQPMNQSQTGQVPTGLSAEAQTRLGTGASPADQPVNATPNRILWTFIIGNGVLLGAILLYVVVKRIRTK